MSRAEVWTSPHWDGSSGLVVSSRPTDRATREIAAGPSYSVHRAFIAGSLLELRAACTRRRSRAPSWISPARWRSSMSTTRKSLASDAVLNVSSPFEPGASSPVAVSATETRDAEVVPRARLLAGGGGAGEVDLGRVRGGGRRDRLGGVVRRQRQRGQRARAPVEAVDGDQRAGHHRADHRRAQAQRQARGPAAPGRAPRPSGRRGRRPRGASSLRTEELRRVAGAGAPPALRAAGDGGLRGGAGLARRLVRRRSGLRGARRPDRRGRPGAGARRQPGCRGCREPGRRAGSGRAPVPRRRRVVARRRTGYPGVPGRRTAVGRGRHERRGCPVTCGGGHRPGSGQHRDARTLGRAVARRSGDGPAGAVRTGASR